MANARKPDNVHLLQGTHQKSRHGNPEDKPQVEIKTPDAPEWLEGKALIEWERICKVLKSSGLLSEADTAVMVQYCLLYSELQTELMEFQAAKHTQLRLCLVELGLTPKARSQITIGGNKKKNDFDDV